VDIAVTHVDLPPELEDQATAQGILLLMEFFDWSVVDACDQLRAFAYECGLERAAAARLLLDVGSSSATLTAMASLAAERRRRPGLRSVPASILG
jgi:hypothetical protein